jgi:hypothetical protein
MWPDGPPGVLRPCKNGFTKRSGTVPEPGPVQLPRCARGPARESWRALDRRQQGNVSTSCTAWCSDQSSNPVRSNGQRADPTHPVRLIEHYMELQRNMQRSRLVQGPDDRRDAATSDRDATRIGR